jgi:hypothetical protein
MSVGSTVQQSFTQTTDTLKHATDGVFSGHSLLILVVCLVVGTLVGKLASEILRQLSRVVGKRADASSNLSTVNRLRRIETWIILSIAIVRLLCVVAALYIWWIATHPTGSQPTALVGASALLIVVVGGVFSPLLRDLAFGSGMMAEHWFGVGDLITVEPFADMQGVVERITLRSTRIRGLNGEVIWVSNQNIAAVRIAQKGTWPMAIELFVTDPTRAEKLIEQTNMLLPTGPSLVARTLTIMTSDQRGEGVWHVTAIGETPPGRQWLLERTAIDLLKKLDEKSKTPVLLADPIPRYADNDTERKFARAVKNARKTRRTIRRPKATDVTKKRK